MAAGLCLGNQYIIHGVSITNLRPRIMQERPRRERYYKINGKLIALSRNRISVREKAFHSLHENFAVLNYHPCAFSADTINVIVTHNDNNKVYAELSLLIILNITLF